MQSNRLTDTCGRMPQGFPRELVRCASLYDEAWKPQKRVEDLRIETEQRARRVEPSVILLEQIETIDLSMVKKKLMDSEEGLGWSQEHTDTIEREYRRYLEMIKLYPDRSIVPTKSVDQFWHQHILDTRAYASDCQRVFGEFVHHFPYFGMRGEEDAKNLEESFTATTMLYAELFGEEHPAVAAAPSAGRCSTCSSCTGKHKCHHPWNESGVAVDASAGRCSKCGSRCGSSKCEHPWSEQLSAA